MPTRSVIPAVVRGLRQLPPTAPQSTAAAGSRPDPVGVDALLSGLPGAVYRCVAGPGRPIVFLAGSVVEVLGSDGPPATGSSLDRLVHPDEREKVARMLADVVADTAFSLEYRIHTDDGRERWVLDRGHAAMAEGRLWLEGVLIDATPERRMHEKLARLALYDALTGLPNRRALLGRAAREVALALSGGTAVSLVLLDVDHFKRVNDAFGHGVGDRVLVELAAALRARVPDGGLVGRLGGEEFALLAPGVGAESLLAAGERVRAAGERVIVGTGPITRSAGAATLTAGEDHESLIARADAALYRAKESVGTGSSWADPGAGAAGSG